jgi:hypothetical protein
MELAEIISKCRNGSVVHLLAGMGGKHGCLSLMVVVYCQADVSMSKLITSTTDRGVYSSV